MQTRSGKRDSSEDIFHISCNHSSRNAKNNQREKSWQDVSVNLSENIPTATETVAQKFSIYLLGMSNHISKFIFKTSKYPFVASLFWYVYFFKKSWFSKVKIAFQLVIFQYFKNHLTKIVHWPHYGTITESSKCWEN